MIEKRCGLCMTGMSELFLTETEPANNETKAFQNMSMALMNLKKQLHTKECDRLMQLGLENRAFFKRYFSGE